MADFPGQRLVLSLKVHNMKGIEQLIPSAANPPCCNLAGTWSDPHLTFTVSIACGNCDSSRAEKWDLCSANSSGVVDIKCKRCEEKEEDNEGEIYILRRGGQAVTTQEAEKAIMEVVLVGKFALSSRDTASRFRITDLVGVVDNQNHKLVRGDEQGYKLEDLPEADYSISTYIFDWTEADWDTKYEKMGLPAQGDGYDTKVPYWPPPRGEDPEEDFGTEDAAIGNQDAPNVNENAAIVNQNNAGNNDSANEEMEQQDENAPIGNGNAALGNENAAHEIAALGNEIVVLENEIAALEDEAATLENSESIGSN